MYYVNKNTVAYTISQSDNCVNKIEIEQGRIFDLEEFILVKKPNEICTLGNGKNKTTNIDTTDYMFLSINNPYLVLVEQEDIDLVQ